MILYYAISAILSFINIALLFRRDDVKKTGFYLRIIFCILALANLGYLAVGLSHTVEEALLANKLGYLGGCFVAPMMFFYICELCNINFPRFVKLLLYAYSILVYLMVLSTGYCDFYYKSAVIGYIGDAATIMDTHGPGYIFFYVILYGYIIANVLLILYAFFRKQVSRKYITPLIIMQILTMSVFLAGRSINPYIEAMPLIYVIDGWILIYLQNTVSRYSIKDSITAAVMQNNTAGYIFFDHARRYIGSNAIARTLIPSLSGYPIDSLLREDHPARFLCQWIDSYDNSQAFTAEISHEGRFYEGKVKSFSDIGKKKGYLIELQDCTDRKKYLDILSHYNRELESRVKAQTRHISDIQRQVILGVASMVENRDNSTGGHIRRTSDIVSILLDSLRENGGIPVSDEFCEDLVRTAPMHDLGKIAIDDRVLRKPGRFTPEEYAVMQTHAEKSAEICENILRGVEEDHLVDVAVHVARYHHEKWDGSGYPEHLSGEAIPMEARIMAVADVYDALVSKRCYKEPMSFDEAYRIMLSSMGSHFDPSLKEVFIAARAKLETYYRAHIS